MDEGKPLDSPQQSTSIKTGGLKDRLQSMRSRRLLNSSNTGGSDEATTTTPDLPSVEERKKLLAKMRAARSSAIARRTQEDSDIEQASEEPSVSTIDDVAHNEEFAEDEEYYRITTIEGPSLDLVDEKTKKESDEGSKKMRKEVLAVPKAKLFAQPSSFDRCCYYSATCCLSCANCYSSSGMTPEGIFYRDERNLVQEQYPAHIHDDKEESSPLLAHEHALPILEDRHYRANEIAGLYRAWLPLLAPILLRGEAILPSISPLTRPYTLLSRNTQRILRDIQTLRNQDQAHLEGSLLHLLVPPFSTFDLIDDPVDHSFKQILLPPVAPAFGGVLGQWKSDASSLQRIGPIPGSLFKLAAEGTLCRLFLFQIVLNSHPLMNIEEHAAAELREIFTQYAGQYEIKAVEFLVYRIRSLCSALHSLVQIPLETLLEDEDSIKHIDSVYRELVELLPALHESSRLLHSLSHSVYGKWQEVVECRRRHSMTTTQVNLKVRRLKSNLSADEKVAREDDRAMQSVAEGEIDRGDVSDISWSTLKADLEQLKEDFKLAQQHFMSISAESSPDKDLTPLQNKLTKEMSLINSFLNDFSKPDYSLLPSYIFQLSESSALTPPASLSKEEQYRRENISQSIYKLIIKVNNQIVTSTKYIGDVELGSNTSVGHIKLPQFIINYKKYIELKLFHMPSDISIDIYCKLNNTCINTYFHINTIHIPIPSKYSNAAATHNSDNNVYFTHHLSPRYGGYSFTSDLFRVDDFAYHKEQWFEKACRMCAEDGSDYKRVSGTLYCAVDFDPLLPSTHPQLDGHPSVELAQIARPSRNVLRGNMTLYDITRELDFQMLLPSFFALDTNSPYNDYLIYLKSKRLSNNENNMFRLTGLDTSEFFIYHDRDMDNTYEDNTHYLCNFLKVKVPLRLKLLALRIRKPFLFNSPVPLSDEIIGKDVNFLQILNKEFPNDNIMHYTKRAYDEDGDAAFLDVNSKRNKITNFLQRVRNSYSIVNKNIMKKHYNTSNVVLEVDYSPELINVQRYFILRKRALKPVIKLREEKLNHIDQCNVLVQVVGARNVPLRDGRGKDNKRTVRSFIEVKFQENILSTISLEGANPYYKTNLSLPFLPPQNDFSPLYLEQVRDVIYFSLFDEVVEDDAERGGFLEGEVTVRSEKYYLGGFTVPFSTLYSGGRLEGVFRLDTPLLNLGYSPSFSLGVGGMNMERAAPSSAPVPTPPRSTVEVCGEMAWVCLTELCPLSFSPVIDLLQQPFVPPPNPSPSLPMPQDYKGDKGRELSYYLSDPATPYLKLLLTLSPLLPPPPVVPTPLLPTNVYRGDKSVLAYASQYLDRIREDREQRGYKAFAMNSSGLQVLLPRYLTPLSPPPGFASFRSLLHLLRSLPFLKDAQAFLGGGMDLWCSCREFWEMGAGDEEEHGVMLYNYLLYLRKDSPDQQHSLFLVIGRGVPEGDTVYILLRDSPPPSSASATCWDALFPAPSLSYSPSHYLLIDPCKGHCYSAQDPYCPLKEIFTLVTPQNIYSNVQLSTSPQSMRYNVEDHKQWKAFFTPHHPAPTGGIVTIQEHIRYVKTSDDYALEVERAVYQALRNNLRKWRSKRHRGSTTFHPEVSNIITEILPKLEEFMKDGGEIRNNTQVNTPAGSANPQDSSIPPATAALDALRQELESRMSNILRTRSLKGFPLSLPFTDVEEIVAKVKTLCIHEAKHPEVQFVLAVRAFPLFNNVVSLWVFIGTLESLMGGVVGNIRFSS